IVGVYLFLRMNPPIEVHTIVSNEENTSIVVGIGNTGFISMNLVDVTVNKKEEPSEVALQVSTFEDGFIVMEDRESAEAEGLEFIDIDERPITIGTVLAEPSESEGAGLEEVEIYGVSIFHEKKVHSVQIKYRHFGMTYEETIQIK